MADLKKYIADHLESWAFDASIAVAVLGTIALAMVLFRWRWLQPRYREFWSKCAVAVFRAIAALSAVAAKVAPTDQNLALWEQPWAGTLLIAAVGYLVWEFAGAVGDHKHKLAKDQTATEHQNEIAKLEVQHQAALDDAYQEVGQAHQDRDDAEYQALRCTRLLAHLRSFVQEKRQRILRLAQDSTATRVPIHATRAGLAPEEQIQFLLEGLASLFRMQAMDADGSQHDQNFRIGLYGEEGGRLVPLAAFDLASRSHEPFTAHQDFADRFELLNTTSPSHAVRCVREGRTLIVADCAADPEFEFFKDQQRNYLRSMVAHPLSGFRPDGVTPARAALLIDTDAANFFREEDREMLELLLREFEARLDLEYAIGGLIG